MPWVVCHTVAFGHEVHEAVGGGGGADAAEGAHDDGARWDLKVRFERQDHAPTQPGLRKFLRHARDAQPDARQRHEQIMRPQLDLRVDAHAAREKILLHIHARACLALKQDQGELRDLRHGIALSKITRIVRRGNEHGMRIHAVADVVDAAVLHFAGKGDVHLPAVQIIEHHAARAVENADANIGVCFMERLQPREKVRFRHRVTRADDELAREELARLGELFLAVSQQPQRVRHIFQQRLPLRGQAHALGAARKQPHLKLLFELLDRLAHRGLRNIQVLRRSGDIPHPRDLFKHPVQLQLDCHPASPH